MQKLEKLLKEIRVLIVDDMESIRNVINGCLRELGVEHTVQANNGEAAWKLLNETRIDMIVCDWDMPQVSGIEFLNMVRNAEEHSHIPFLMLTAESEKEKVSRAIKAGVSDYLTKPFQPKELEYRVIKLLRKVKLS
ncbi:MAG: response regulator [Cellvibrionaceae bacterium]